MSWVSHYDDEVLFVAFFAFSKPPDVEESLEQSGGERKEPTEQLKYRMRTGQVYTKHPKTHCSPRNLTDWSLTRTADGDGNRPNSCCICG